MGRLAKSCKQTLQFHILGFEATQVADYQLVRLAWLQRFPIDMIGAVVVLIDGNETFCVLVIAIHPCYFGAWTKCLPQPVI